MITKQNIKMIIKRIWTDIKNFRIAIILFAAWNIIVRNIFHAYCPFLIFSGFPCAGCGMTRAIFYIMTGQFTRGIRLNPAAPMWIIFIIWFFWNRYARGTYKKSTMMWLGIICAVTFIIYVYRMINYFPENPPLVYYRNNILSRAVHFGGR